MAAVPASAGLCLDHIRTDLNGCQQQTDMPACWSSDEALLGNSTGHAAPTCPCVLNSETSVVMLGLAPTCCRLAARASTAAYTRNPDLTCAAHSVSQWHANRQDSYAAAWHVSVCRTGLESA